MGPFTSDARVQGDPAQPDGIVTFYRDMPHPTAHIWTTIQSGGS